MEPEPEPHPAFASFLAPPEPPVDAEVAWPSADGGTGDGDDDWSPDADSTRVLPTSWEPPTAADRTEPGELDPEAGSIRTSLGGTDADEDAEAASTAEQAVPWLIGLILLLAGMVIVLLALIFAGDGSLGGTAGQTASAAAAVVVPSRTASPSPTLLPTPSETAETAAPTPTPVPIPEYGPLEMIYQGRAAALAPIYLLGHDFTTEEDPDVLAQDPNIDVRRFTWAPDGRVGAGLLADVLVSIEPGESKRNLGTGISTITFGDDGSTVYAVRVTTDGGNDVATVLAIGFGNGDTEELASVSYERPTVGAEPALPEAQFTDEGGTVRLYWMSDGRLRLWVLGASTWDIDPGDGDVTDLEGDELPVLVDPDGEHRIAFEEDEGETTLRYLSASDAELATTSVSGLVSHLRWSRSGDRVVFTVGRSASGGGVLQDLFLWDLETEAAPMQLTTTGAAFGAVWRGASPRWETS
jgi:hypothetical protein